MYKEICRRDFTYVDDIVEGIARVMQRAPSARPAPMDCPSPLMPCTT